MEDEMLLPITGNKFPLTHNQNIFIYLQKSIVDFNFQVPVSKMWN